MITGKRRSKPQERKHPHTVTRGLPYYVIGADYRRLLRLTREYQHMDRWHSETSQRLIIAQCQQLYYKVYGSVCTHDNFQP